MSESHMIAPQAHHSCPPLTPSRIVRGLIGRGIALSIAAWNATRPQGLPPLGGNLNEDMRFVINAARERSDISDHLATLYAEAVESSPRLMVELGVGPGRSTQVLIRAAERVGARLVSVDIEDRSSVARSSVWTFVQADDVQLGENWPSWAHKAGISPTIDFLFIDTSHLYEHTLAEIQVWFPHLAPRATVVFHDTNMARWYRRRDGSIGGGWDNARGVIRAIEAHLGVSIDEKQPFTGLVGPWLIRHDPVCNGLTILHRLTMPLKPNLGQHSTCHDPRRQASSMGAGLDVTSNNRGNEL